MTVQGKSNLQVKLGTKRKTNKIIAKWKKRKYKKCQGDESDINNVVGEILNTSDDELKGKTSKKKSAQKKGYQSTAELAGGCLKVGEVGEMWQEITIAAYVYVFIVKKLKDHVKNSKCY